jgi:SRSO17 transposase
MIDIYAAASTVMRVEQVPDSDVPPQHGCLRARAATGVAGQCRWRQQLRPSPSADERGRAGSGQAAGGGAGAHRPCRSIDDGELAFYHCYNPRRESFGELVRVAGARWPIEECFEASKGGVGLDDYQVRLYHAWYRHVTLAMLARAFLTICDPVA